MTTDLDALQALCDAAFKGPWISRTWEVECEHYDCDDSHDLETVLAPEEYPAFEGDPQVVAQVSQHDGAITTPGLEQFASANAAFIAAARTALPVLLDIVRAADALEANTLDMACGCHGDERCSVCLNLEYAKIYRAARAKLEGAK